MLGFNSEEKTEYLDIVPSNQDPYKIFRGELVSIEYGSTRTVGKYLGLTRFNKLFLQPHYRRAEVVRDRNISLIKDSKPCLVSLDAVMNVEPRTEIEMERCVNEDIDFDQDPACLI